MKLILLLGALCLSACRPADSAGIRDEAITAITNVAVIPMDGERVLPDQTVIVRGGVIVEIGPASHVATPEGAQRIDGTDMYLMPGLTDAHVHLRDPSELLSYLAHGVTTVVHLGGPTGNVPDVAALRDRVLRGAIPGPTVYRSGRILDGDPAIFPGVSTVVRTPAEAEQAVAEQLDAGADFIKVYNNLRADPLRAAIAAAHRRDAAVWGHIPRVDGRADALDRVLSAGLDVIAHGEEIFFTSFYDDVERQLNEGRVPDVADERLIEAVRRIRESGVAVTPNLSFIAMTRVQLDDPAALESHTEARFLHPEVRSMWREQAPSRRNDLERFDRRERGKRRVVRTLTRMMQEAGVPLLLGTDASAAGMFPGSSAHVELEELVGAGLSAYEALATATRTPGRLFQEFGVDGPPFGTVTVGSRADLLMLEANPLADVANARRVAGVMARGEWYPRSSLDSLRARGTYGD